MFALSAIPTLRSDGRHKGPLESVTFIATDGFTHHQWSSTNIEALADNFAGIVPRANADDLFRRLRRGDPVLFPGLFELEVIRHNLGGPSND
jgi:hypothetical protein